jgi:catechol 2,3-dioxygenase-like lactoylglutathione lyase family enzyme
MNGFAESLQSRPLRFDTMAIAHLALPVRDVRRAVRFFEEALGWRPIDRPGNIAVTAAWLEIAPGQQVHLLERPDFAPSPFEDEYGRHIAISVSVASLPILKQRLQAQGAEVFAAIRPTPFDRFFFRDGDGYVFEVVAAERASET